MKMSNDYTYSIQLRLTNIDPQYKKLFKDGGMEDEAAAYLYFLTPLFFLSFFLSFFFAYVIFLSHKLHLMEALNPDPIDAQSLGLRKPLPELEAEENAAWDRTTFFNQRGMGVVKNAIHKEK